MTEAQAQDSFERVLPLSDIIYGRARSAMIWGVVGAVSLFLGLLCLLMLVSVFEHRGRLTVPREQYNDLKAVAAFSSEQTPSDTILPYSDSGVLPTAWRQRGRLTGAVAGGLYRASLFFQGNESAVIAFSLFVLLLGLLWSTSVALNQRAAAAASGLSANRLRRGIHRQALRLAPSNLSSAGTDEALTLFLDRTDKVQSGLSKWVTILTRDGLELVSLAAFLLLIQWRVGLLCLIPIAVCLYLLMRLSKAYEERDEAADQKTSSELSRLAEGLKKSRLVRAYGMEEHEQTQFTGTLDRYTNNRRSQGRGYRLHRWLVRLTILLVALFVLYFVFGERMLRENENRLPLADAVLIVGVLVYMTFPLSRVLQLASIKQETANESAAIQRYIGRIPEVGQAVGARFVEPLSRVLQFDAVQYSDESGPLLQGLDLKVNAGEIVAIVSMNEAEARAAAYMIPRFIEPTSGRVLLDGEDIAWVTLDSLRAEAVFVGGNEPFFTGTVLENLTCGDSAYSKQQATEAAKQTHAHNFILELPSGYETKLGEDGVTLSPGQAFRLSLARAVLRKPALLVIEEPAESLETDDKSLIDDAYTRLAKDRTIIVLPTRLSTVKKAHTVVMLHQGRVEGSGKQEKLVKSSPMYRHWEYTRFNEFRDGRA